MTVCHGTLHVRCPQLEHAAQVTPVFQEAKDKMTAAGVKFIDIDMSDILSAPGATYDSLSNFEPGREFSRYLYTHNYTESVKTVYDQINSPSVRSFALPALGYGITTPQGDVDAWTDFLGRGELMIIRSDQLTRSACIHVQTSSVTTYYTSTPTELILGYLKLIMGASLSYGKFLLCHMA